MADGSPKTPAPSAVAAQARAGAPAAQGDMDRICLPCAGLIPVPVGAAVPVGHTPGGGRGYGGAPLLLPPAIIIPGRDLARATLVVGGQT